MKTAGVVAFAFGAPDTIRSNWRIAKIASQKAWKLDTPVYTQLDVCVEPGIEVKYTDEIPGDPPPTLRIARGAVQWAKQEGFKELWVVAANPHLWRVLRDIKKAVREVGGGIEVYSCGEIEQYPEDSWFCPDSTQDRVHSKKTWDKRERILKIMPFFLYKRVAN